MSPEPNEQPRLRAIDGGADDRSDEDLLDEVARGSRDAFDQLYDRYGGQVYGVVRKVLRDPARSEEVTQEIFVEIWRTATKFDRERGSASTWIFTMAHRRAIDRVRSVQSSRDRDERIGHENRVRPFDQVSEEVETRLEHRQVRAALEQLTDLQREAVELAYYGGYTYREVAELLGSPLGTVKTRIRDGLIRLRDALGVTA